MSLQAGLFGTDNSSANGHEGVDYLSRTTSRSSTSTNLRSVFTRTAIFACHPALVDREITDTNHYGGLPCEGNSRSLQ
jgi:hypothetical protein